jgi:outer membrane PBP1 activator LpoA protein
LIIGPLTAAEVEAAKPIAANDGINILAFSNQVQVAGGNVYLLGFLPQQEAQRIADFAHASGIDHFGILAPSSAYGQLAAQSFQADVNRRHGGSDTILRSGCAR